MIYSTRNQETPSFTQTLKRCDSIETRGMRFRTLPTAITTLEMTFDINMQDNGKIVT